MLSSAAEDKRQELSLREKQKLVDSHNYLRSIADPPATDMQRMVIQALINRLTSISSIAT